MDGNNTFILDADQPDDTDIAYINNEMVHDALLLMGGMYYVTMHSEAAHSTLTPSQRLVLLTSQVPLPLGCGWELSPQEDGKRCM